MKLTIATCQFPVDRDIRGNLSFVLRQMKIAKRRGAHVAHFSEACLSGYAGSQFNSFTGFKWNLLVDSTGEVMALAKELKLWVILGSTHRLSGRHKPHNSLYIINDGGRVVDRYDKMFCCGKRSGKTGDLRYYTPGSHFCVFTIRGVRCGTLICHDFRYDQLYRVYRRRGVRVMFHSYHLTSTRSAARKSNYREIVPATMQTYAANNHIWISANNSSRPVCACGSFFVRPEGVITGRLRANHPGLLISTVDTARKFDDACDWRDRAMAGVYHSGKLVRDRRSDRRTQL